MKKKSTKRPKPKMALDYIAEFKPQKEPIVVEVNIKMLPRVPYYRPLSRVIWEGFVSAYIGAITGLIILAFGFI